jgi:hypothetical protein
MECKVSGVLEMVLLLFIGTETEHIADANVYPSGTQASFQAVGTVEVPVSY